MRDFSAPDEARAQARTWNVVAAAFAEREAAPVRRRVPVRALAAVAAVAALAAVAFTPPGDAVLTSVRKAIGVEHAQRALYSLPTGGRILAGSRIVAADGSTRNLGAYGETSWSPFGHFVVATKPDELLALQTDGSVRWTLARPDVRFPRWGGSRVDTRIAYLSGGRLRVVAGDGTGDREVGPAAAAPVAPAWRPGAFPLALAYADTRGHVWVFEPDTRRLLFRVDAPHARALRWSADGRRLLVLTRTGARVLDTRGRLVARIRGRYVDGQFVGRRLALLAPHALTLDGRTLFRTSGVLGQLALAPDRRWLLVSWPEAGQWVFVPIAQGLHLRAAGNTPPGAIAGWTS